MVMVPPGVPHTFANPGEVPAVMVSTVTPDLYMRYFEDLRDWVAGGRPMTPEAQAEIMSRYATVPATDHATEPTLSPPRARSQIPAPHSQVRAPHSQIRAPHSQVPAPRSQVRALRARNFVK